VAFAIRKRTQVFLSSFGPISQHFALKRHLLRASLYRKQLGERFAAWHRFHRTHPRSVCFLKSCRGFTLMRRTSFNVTMPLREIH